MICIYFSKESEVIFTLLYWYCIGTTVGSEKYINFNLQPGHKAGLCTKLEASHYFTV